MFKFWLVSCVVCLRCIGSNFKYEHTWYYIMCWGSAWAKQERFLAQFFICFHIIITSYNYFSPAFCWQAGNLSWAHRMSTSILILERIILLTIRARANSQCKQITVLWITMFACVRPYVCVPVCECRIIFARSFCILLEFSHLCRKCVHTAQRHCIGTYHVILDMSWECCTHRQEIDTPHWRCTTVYSIS